MINIMENHRSLYRYSPDSTRLATVTLDGRLMIWNSSNSEIVQQYSPSSHLSAQIICLAWSPAGQANKSKKKSKQELTEGGKTDLIALGTTAGTVLVYSLTQGDIVTTFEVSNHKVMCVAWSNSGNSVISGSQDGDITICSVLSLEILSRFKSGKDAIHAIAVSSDDKKIISASQKIKIFEVKSQNLVQTLVGHATEVTFLECIKSGAGGEDTFILSAAANDTHVSVWKLKDYDDSEDIDIKAAKKPEPVFTTLAVNESVSHFSILPVEKDEIITAASTDRGTVAVFRCSLEKKRKKPTKPFSKLRIMSEKVGKGQVPGLHVYTTRLISRGDAPQQPYLTIAYGSETKVMCEEVKVAELREDHLMVRKMPLMKINGEQHKDFTKVVSAKNADDVKYLMAGGVNIKKAVQTRGEKRPNDSKQENLEPSLEERLALCENPSKKTDSLAQLLVQGLHSKNKALLQSVLDRKEIPLIELSVKSLPVEYVVPLLEVLFQRLSTKSINMCHVLWAQCLVRTHVGYLVSSPHLQKEILLPLSDLISQRTANFLPILKLKGKIEMIQNQMKKNRNDEVTVEQPAQIVFQDDSSDNSDSDDEGKSNLLPPRVEYDSDFLDEYLSGDGAGGEGSSSDELENGINVSSSDDDDAESAQLMETENVGNRKKMANGHRDESDDMEED